MLRRFAGSGTRVASARQAPRTPPSASQPGITVKALAPIGRFQFGLVSPPATDGVRPVRCQQADPGSDFSLLPEFSGPGPLSRRKAIPGRFRNYLDFCPIL